MRRIWPIPRIGGRNPYREAGAAVGAPGGNGMADGIGGAGRAAATAGGAFPGERSWKPSGGANNAGGCGA